jgi:hypothetical protein
MRRWVGRHGKLKKMRKKVARKTSNLKMHSLISGRSISIHSAGDEYHKVILKREGNAVFCPCN